MGLTIHYEFQLPGKQIKVARQVISCLRDIALNLPFAEVSPIVELKGDDCDRLKNKNEDLEWLLIQSMHWYVRGNTHCCVAPKHFLGFTALVGDGCEPMNIGLCLYPGFGDFHGKRVRTNAPSGWSWSSFCKTQYASNPDCGGVENFLNCHTTVISMLDTARQAGVSTEVDDEGDYWKNRDIEELAIKIGLWNDHMAGFAATLQEKLGVSKNVIASEISKYPNLEYLEANAIPV